MTFNEVQILLQTAKSPEEVFPKVETLAGVRKLHRQLAAIVHPDASPQSAIEADAPFKRLATWLQRAEEKFKEGTWGDGKLWPEFHFRGRKGVYGVFGLERREALFDSLACAGDDSMMSLMIARKPRYEMRVPFAKQALDAMEGRGAPSLIEVVKLKDRTAYITSAIPYGFVSLESILTKYPDGVPPRLILPRLLTLLQIIAIAGERNIVHGAINPGTWWVHLRGDDSLLLDWHYSTPTGGIVEYQNTTFRGFCPWEVREEKPTDRGTDMAAAMFVLREALGTQATPDELDRLICDHMLEGRARPSDPSRCFQRVRGILANLSTNQTNASGNPKT